MKRYSPNKKLIDFVNYAFGSNWIAHFHVVRIQNNLQEVFIERVKRVRRKV